MHCLTISFQFSVSIFFSFFDRPEDETEGEEEADIRLLLVAFDHVSNTIVAEDRSNETDEKVPDAQNNVDLAEDDELDRCR